jgi:hypothetical protein
MTIFDTSMHVRHLDINAGRNSEMRRSKNSQFWFSRRNLAFASQRIANIFKADIQRHFLKTIFDTSVHVRHLDITLVEIVK